MSYDIQLVDPRTREVCKAPCRFPSIGGIVQVGGQDTLWANLTWNYAPIFRSVLGDSGIRTIYGKTAKETRTLLLTAATQLKSDTDEDYWKPTEGNVKVALLNLVAMACMAPDDAVWEGD